MDLLFLLNSLVAPPVTPPVQCHFIKPLLGKISQSTTFCSTLTLETTTIFSSWEKNTEALEW